MKEPFVNVAINDANLVIARARVIISSARFRERKKREPERGCERERER